MGIFGCVISDGFEGVKSDIEKLRHEQSNTTPPPSKKKKVTEDQVPVEFYLDKFVDRFSTLRDIGVDIPNPNKTREGVVRQVVDSSIKELDWTPKYKNRWNFRSIEDVYGMLIKQVYQKFIPDIISVIKKNYPGYKICVTDLHRHSESSNIWKWNLLHWISPLLYDQINKRHPDVCDLFASPESYMTKEVLFKKTFEPDTITVWKEKCPTLWSISDHDTIKEWLRFQDYAKEKDPSLLERTFLMEEASVTIPTMWIAWRSIPETVVHIKATGINNKEEANIIQSNNKNIFDFIKVTREFWHHITLAHGLLNMWGLHTEHILLLSILLDNFELNIERLACDNVALVKFLHGLDSNTITELYNHFDWILSPYFQWEMLVNKDGMKRLNAWTDDHSWLYMRDGMASNLIVVKELTREAIMNALHFKDGFIIPNLSMGLNRWIKSVLFNSLFVSIHHILHQEKMSKYITFPLKKIIADITCDELEITKVTKYDILRAYYEQQWESSLDAWLQAISWKWKSSENSTLWIITSEIKQNLWAFWNPIVNFLENTDIWKELYRFAESVIIEGKFTSEMKKFPELYSAYRNAIKQKRDFTSWRVDRNAYNESLYRIVEALIQYILKELVEKVNENEYTKIDYRTMMFPIIMHLFVVLTVDSLYANKHLHQWLKEKWYINTPDRKQKTLFFISEIEKNYWAAKTVLSLIRSKQRQTNLHVITAVKDLEKFTSSDLYTELTTILWEDNFDVFKSTATLDFETPISFPSFQLIFERIIDIHPTSLVNWAYDATWFWVERIANSLNIPVNVVGSADYERFFTEKIWFSLFGKLLNDTLMFAFHWWKSKSISRVVESFVERWQIEDKRKWHTIKRFFNPKVFFPKNPAHWFLQKNNINEELWLPDYINQYKQEPVSNIVYFWWMEKKLELSKTIKSFFEYFAKEMWKFTNKDDWNFADIRKLFVTVPIFHIIWEWEDFNELKKLSISRDIPMVFYGKHPEENKLVSIINNCNFSMYPSRTQRIWRMVMEWMACAKPSITYSQWWARVFINENMKDWLIAESDEEYFTYLKLCIDNPLFVRNLWQRAYEHVSTEFSEQKVVSEFDQMIRQDEARHKKILQAWKQSQSAVLNLLDSHIEDME